MEPVAPGRSWVPQERYPPARWWTRRRRRVALYVGIPLGTLLVLVVAAWLALPYFVRAYVLQRLEARFGVTIEAADIDAGFGYVRFEDVRVRSGETGLPLGHLDVLEADVDLWALLRGRIGLRRLEVRHPELDIRVRGDDDWAEVVRIARRAFRGGRRLAGGGGGATPEVVVRDLAVRFAFGGELSFSASIPDLRIGGDRRLQLVGGGMSLEADGVELARAASSRATATLRGGEVRLEEAVVTGGALRWERAPGRPLGDAPPLRALDVLRRMVRIARAAPRPPADAAASGASRAAPATALCDVPLEGSIRFEDAVLAVSEPRLGPGTLRSSDVDGSALLERCGARIRLEARADGGPREHGWAGWAERTALGTSGEFEVEAASLDALVRRIWPGHELPAASGEPARFELGHRPGESAVHVAGLMPVPALELSAGGWHAATGPERSPFELRVGPVEGKAVGLAGRIGLSAASLDGPDGPASVSGLAVRIDPDTRVAAGLDGSRLVVGLEAVLSRRVRVLDAPRLEVERPQARADVTLDRLGGGRIGVEGSFQLEGLLEREPGSEVDLPVLLAGAMDAGTWVDAPARAASLRGRFLADGLRVDRRGTALVAFGAPGIEVALDIAPGPGDGQWGAAGSIGVRGLTVDSPRIAREPVTGIAFDLSGQFAVDLRARTAALEQGRARIGAVEMAINAALALHDGVPAFRVAFAGARTRCQDLLEALPVPLRSDLPGLEFGGSADFTVAFDVDFADLRSTIFELDATSRCRVTAADGSIQMDRLRGTFRHEIVLPDGRTETVLTGPGSPDWVPLGDISPYMVSAVITTEDARFFRHSGVSISDLRAAIVRDLREGRFAAGGSTIDMQVVKNVFLDREKTLARKVQEVILTWWLDQALDKNQIMELYLNVIEYGPRLYGIGPAARHFFGRAPADLSPLEAIYLAKLLPDPISRYGMYRQGGVSPRWRSRLDRLLGIMTSRGELSEAEYQAAIHDQLDFWYPGEPLPPPRYGDIPPGSEVILLSPEQEEMASIAEEIYGEDADLGVPGTPDL
ncbi:MAG: transglycosylase domain-containing protein [Deltaproteobacteria bacterium]|nr:transglycosylase domain-containing protein [Deltaproteobacteria bacterium]